MIKKIWEKIVYWVTYPYKQYKAKKELEKKLEELKKQDPFIYK